MTGTEAPWKLVATFTLAGLLSGAALAGVHVGTESRIRANQAQTLARAVLATVPGAQRFEPVLPKKGATRADGGAYATFDADGRPLAFAVRAEGPGFMDTIKLLYGLDAAAEKVVGLFILGSRETPGLGDKIAYDPAFVGSFADLSVKPAIVAASKREADNEVDCITGATVSSKAVVAIVQASVNQWLPRLRALQQGQNP